MMSEPKSASADAQVSSRHAWFLILTLAAGLFCVRLFGPDNLAENDQERPTSYVLDAVQNARWAIQRDAYGDVASKPPLYTWLAGILTLAAGRISRWSIYLPCGLAVAATAGLILATANKHFGTIAGLLGAFSFLFCQFGIKNVALARTDALFGFTVTLAALAAWRAWNRGHGWTWFWLASAAATLTKGPLGLLLASGGLLAAVWERRGGERPALRGILWPGVLLWLAVVGGWFALAYAQDGAALVRKQLGGELAGHLTGSSIGGKYPGYMPHFTILYFLSRYAPWSVVALAACWRVWRSPAGDATERRFERFLFCWFWAGMLVFTIAPHKRADLLLPLVPAAALLAGRELARWLARVRPAVIWRATAVSGTVLLVALAIAGSSFDRPARRAVSPDLRHFAWWLQSTMPPNLPLTFEGENLSLEFYLNRHQLVVWPEAAARLLQGDAACFIATRNLPGIRQHLPPGFEIFVLHTVPTAGPLEPQLISNRPDLVAPGRLTAAGIGPLRVRLDGLALQQARNTTLVLRRLCAGGQATLVNDSATPVVAGVEWFGEPVASSPPRRTLSPGESWTVTAQ